jgi:hypothetical protein
MESRFPLRLEKAERDYESSLLRLDMAEEECREAAGQLVALYDSAAARLLVSNQDRAALKAHAQAMSVRDRDGFGQAVLDLARRRGLRPDRAVVRGIEIR